MGARLADFAPRLARARDDHERRVWELSYCASGSHDPFFPDDNGRCAVCGDLHGSTVDAEPYDFSAARRELETIHAYIRRHGLEQAEDGGQWGSVVGYYQPEWGEVGNTVQALEWVAAVAGEDGYFRGLEDFEPGITKAPAAQEGEGR
jgi:hypothetical protein